MRHPLRFLALLVLAVSLPALALAQEVPPASDLDPIQILASFVRAIQGGQWPVAVVLVLVGLIWLVRKFGTGWWPWLKTSEGGTVMAFLTVLGSVLGAAALVPGAHITWTLVGQAAAAAFASIGAWTGARRLLRVLIPLAAKVPKVGPALAAALAWLSGGDAPAPAPVP